MLRVMNGDTVNWVFAVAPLCAFVAVLLVLYRATHAAAPRERVPLGKTYACAQCGRRGKHEHMVPVTHEGAVVWYCARCAH